MFGAVGPTSAEILGAVHAQAFEAGGRLHPPPGLDALVACGTYRDGLAELIRHGKYRSDDRPFRILGRSLALEFMASTSIDLDRSHPRWVVVPVPQHPWRTRHRGIDHADELARAFAKEIRLPVKRWLRRTWGPTQVGRRPTDRRRVSATLRCRRTARRQVAQLTAKVGASCGAIVVDDVVTTGATLSACARILRNLGLRTNHAAVGCVSPGRFEESLHQSSTSSPRED